MKILDQWWDEAWKNLKAGPHQDSMRILAVISKVRLQESVIRKQDEALEFYEEALYTSVQSETKGRGKMPFMTWTLDAGKLARQTREEVKKMLDETRT